MLEVLAQEDEERRPSYSDLQMVTNKEWKSSGALSIQVGEGSKLYFASQKRRANLKKNATMPPNKAIVEQAIERTDVPTAVEVRNEETPSSVGPVRVSVPDVVPTIEDPPREVPQQDVRPESQREIETQKDVADVSKNNEVGTGPTSDEWLDELVESPPASARDLRELDTSANLTQSRGTFRHTESESRTSTRIQNTLPVIRARNSGPKKPPAVRPQKKKTLPKPAETRDRSVSGRNLRARPRAAVTWEQN
jgi:hypothetical protein